MHPCRETDTLPLEGLQTTPYDGVLLQHRHLKAFLSQQGSSHQATNATTDDYAGFHFRKV